MKKSARLYCLPNRFGFAFFGVFVLMLVVGATYQNNLVYIMAFLLLALNLAGIIQTARNVRGIKLLGLEVQPHYAGEKTTAVLRLYNPTSHQRFALEVVIEKFGTRHMVEEIGPGEMKSCTITIQLPDQWGLKKVGRVRLESAFPYGLFRVWFARHLDAEIFIYPRPEGDVSLPLKPREQGEDFSHLKTFEPGEPRNRIYWASLARGGELQSKQFHETTAEHIEFVFQRGTDTERRLRQLSLWVALAERHRVDYSLRTERATIPTGSGVAHFHRCMKELVRAAL